MAGASGAAGPGGAGASGAAGPGGAGASGAAGPGGAVRPDGPVAPAAPAAQPAGLISVDDYLAEVLAAIKPLPPRELSLDRAGGCVLAADLAAAWPLPPFDNSAMDGYAVIAADTAQASAEAPVRLPVRGEIAAGDTGAYHVSRGTCARIMTGAPMPGGADAVVPVEWTDGGDEVVAVHQPASPGNAVRHSGDDAPAGQTLLRAGTRLGPPQVALAAASGQAVVLAWPRPRVAVISTGDELTEPGAPLARGRIWESNSYLLATAARQAGCEVRRLAAIPDDKAAVLAAVEDALADADLLITSGGVSMGGEHDVVKAALSELGTVRFRKVAMQPGMPQGFGVLGSGSTPIFTLPGNPVSAYVSFCVFVVPVLQVLSSHLSERITRRTAALSAPARSPAGKRSFLRGVLDREAGTVAPVSGQSSHQLAALAGADALIIVPEQVTALPAGETVDVLELG
jgi:molybdopterin molybdotransferase